MATVKLPNKLVSPLEQLANVQGASLEEVVEEAIMEYLREQRHKQLMQEMNRFREKHGDLKAHYLGQFIGMYDGRVLDHDHEGGLLYNRLRQEYGDLPILIVKVGEKVEQEFNRLSRHIVSGFALLR